MCGITGALSLNHKGIDTACARPMADIISHRGPDDAGYLFFHTGTRHKQKISFEFNLTDDNFLNLSKLLPSIDSQEAKNKLGSHDWDLFLGHRRLSVLDLSAAGHQPMSDLSKNIWISFNGEIYNYKEIKETLIKEGYHFHTQTDTEMIIYAYIHWGIECINKFNGMFAFALYDNFSKTLYLARDRYGIKPLYYTVTKSEKNNNHTLLFSSEVKSLLQYKGYKIDLDCEALMEYFTFQNIFSDRTLYKDVCLLKPGHFIKIDLNTAQAINSIDSINSFQYWDFDFQEPGENRKEQDYLEELHFLFSRAVKRQLISDVEIGSFLSGGMDSGSISCIAASENPNLKTFTIGFDLNSISGIEMACDERRVSEYLSYLYKTEHYEMVLKSGDMERCLPKFAWHLEEPRVGQSYPNFYASKLAGNFVKVVLGGTGGDELFGGYPWRYYRAVVNKDFDDYIDKYYVFWQRLMRNKDLIQVFKPISQKVTNVWTRDIFKNVFHHNNRPCTSEEYVNQSLYFEAKTFLHGLFVVEDKLSMAHSLETRVPFMDNDLVDFAMKLPVKFKLGNLQEVIKLDENESGIKKEKYYHKTNDGKLLLRKMMQHYVPEKITSAVKQGFSSPDNLWFRGDSIEYVKKHLLNKNALIYNYFDPVATHRLINEHLEGKKNRRLLIWSLLNFEHWLDQYFS